MKTTKVINIDRVAVYVPIALNAQIEASKPAHLKKWEWVHFLLNQGLAQLPETSEQSAA
ncbi:MAG: hypothetical protein KME42_13770 [Tildeniella nuda ZEHNDER 1965/U140]|nr:hypothetical protein [Tildeniella nuda ZEHNDER 1965/U140]